MRLTAHPFFCSRTDFLFFLGRTDTTDSTDFFLRKTMRIIFWGASPDSQSESKSVSSVLSVRHSSIFQFFNFSRHARGDTQCGGDSG